MIRGNPERRDYARERRSCGHYAGHSLEPRDDIRQNLVFAFAYNVIGIPIAAGVLYPNFGLLLSPIIAALAMSLSSVSVIGNAVRLDTLKL